MFKVIKILVIFLFLFNNKILAQVHIKFINSKNYKQIHTLRAKDSLQAWIKIQNFINRQRQKGWLEASADSVLMIKNKFIVYVHKGEKYFLDSLVLTDGTDTVIINKRKQFFYPNIIDDFSRDYINDLRNRGYAFAKLTDKFCKLKDNHFVCNVKVKRGDYFVFDTLKILDTVKISRKFLQSYLALSIGKPFSYKLIQQIPSRLSSLKFISLIDTPQVEFYPGLARPVLFLKRINSNSASALVGMIYDNGDLTTVGQIQLHTIGLLQAEDFSFFWSRPRTMWQQMKVSLQVPYIIGSPVGLKMNVFNQKIDTTRLNFSLATGLAYYFYNLSSISFLWKIDNNFTVYTSSSEQIVKKRLFQFSINLDNIRNVFVFSQGWKLQADLGYGKKSFTDSLSWIVEYKVDVQKFFVIAKRLSILTRWQTFGMWSPFILNNELVYIGGYQNFRGFNEQQFSASAYNLITLEPRFYLNSNYIFVFVEKGNIVRKTISYDTKFNTLAFGFGINLHLNNSAFIITYALGSENRNFDFSASKIHLSYRLIF